MTSGCVDSAVIRAPVESYPYSSIVLRNELDPRSLESRLNSLNVGDPSGDRLSSGALHMSDRIYVECGATCEV